MAIDGEHSVEMVECRDDIEVCESSSPEQDGVCRPQIDFQNECESIGECLLKDLFNHSEFQSDIFCNGRNHDGKSVLRFSRKDEDIVKADIVTAFIRRMSTVLSLTKT